MADTETPPPFSSNELNVKPIVVVIVVVLSVVLICSGALQLLARCLGRRYALGPAIAALTASGTASNSNSLSNRLQNLFQLHEGGLDQGLIDTLPVFLYGTIRGLKDGADCAVCLSEFDEEDHLRLLPKCKHAFHLDCIDTWLLSNSTCPLCRRSLLPEDSLRSTSRSSRLPRAPGAQSPVPSESTSSGSYAEVVAGETERDRGSSRGSRGSSFRTCELDSSSEEPDQEQALGQARPMQPVPTVCVTEADGSERVMRVELRKVKTLDSEDNCESNNNAIEPGATSSESPPGCSSSRGSYQYLLDSSSTPREMMITIPARFPISPPPAFQESHGGGGGGTLHDNTGEEVRDQQSYCMNPGKLKEEDENRISEQESDHTLLLLSERKMFSAAQKISINTQEDTLPAAVSSAVTTNKTNAVNIIRLSSSSLKLAEDKTGTTDKISTNTIRLSSSSLKLPEDETGITDMINAANTIRLSLSSLKLPEDKTGTTDKINAANAIKLSSPSIKLPEDTTGTTDKINANTIRSLSSSFKLPKDKTGTADKINANTIRLSSSSLRLPEDRAGTSIRWFRRCLSDHTAILGLRLESSSRDYDNDDDDDHHHHHVVLEMPSSVSTTLPRSLGLRKSYTLNCLMGRTMRLVSSAMSPPPLQTLSCK